MYLDQGGGYEEVGGLRCYLPKMPPKNEIAGFELKKKDQKFTRIKLPEYWDERRAEEKYKQDKEQILVDEGKIPHIRHFDPVLEKFRLQQWTYRYNGYWFYNNGVETWIPGPCWFYLNWCKLSHDKNDGYPFYYDTLRKRFYFRQRCQEDPFCLGYIIVGPRGPGKTSEEAAMVIEDITRPPGNRHAALQSLAEDDAKKVIFKQKLVPIYNYLPDFFKPVSNHGSNPEAKLSFYRDTVKGKKARAVIHRKGMELSNSIYPTKGNEKALDGETLADILNDEIGKFENGNAYLRHHVNRYCVYRNHQKVGMIRSITTVEEMDKGGKECYKIWAESDINDRTENGYTKSGIYRLFVNAVETTTKYADEYGFVDEDKALKYHQAEREALKNDPVALNQYKRKFPFNEREAFFSNASGCAFNEEVIIERLGELNAMKHEPYVKGNFYWLDGKKDGIVGFKEDKHSGRFLVSFLFEDAKESNQVGYDVLPTDNSKLWYPKNDLKFAIGSDPINDVKTKDPRASKAAAHGFRKLDLNLDGGKDKKNWLTHNVIFEYLYRPEEFDTYGEDLIMACRYYGCSINPESNIQSIWRYFKSRGYEKFVTRKRHFDDTVIGGKKDDNPMRSDQDVIQSYIDIIRPFINEHGHRFPFPRTLEQLLNFEPRNPTSYDAVVSLGYTLIGSKRIVEEDYPVDDIGEWLDEYQYSGTDVSMVESTEEYEEDGDDWLF